MHEASSQRDRYRYRVRSRGRDHSGVDVGQRCGRDHPGSPACRGMDRARASSVAEKDVAANDW
jgi:hypothetical protein